MTSKNFRDDALHVFTRHVACLFLVFSISCPAALSERRVDSDGYVINDLLRLEEPVPGALRVADSWDYSQQFFFLDRDMTQDASETKAWTEEDKKLVTSRLRCVHRKWPELFTNLGHKVCFYRADNIKDPARPSAKSSTIAATIYRTITFSNIFFRLPDYEEVSTLVHELVHVIDTGHPISHSPAWVTFVRTTPSLIRADGKYEEALADYIAICLQLNAIADVRALLEKLRSANPENPQIADLSRRAQELERKLIAKPRNTKQVRAPNKNVEP